MADYNHTPPGTHFDWQTTTYTTGYSSIGRLQPYTTGYSLRLVDYNLHHRVLTSTGRLQPTPPGTHFDWQTTTIHHRVLTSTGRLQPTPPGTHLDRLLLVDAETLHDAQDLLVELADLGVVADDGAGRQVLGGPALRLHPLVVLDLLDREALGRVQHQHAPDQLLALCKTEHTRSVTGGESLGYRRITWLQEVNRSVTGESLGYGRITQLWVDHSVRVNHSVTGGSHGYG